MLLLQYSDDRTWVEPRDTVPRTFLDEKFYPAPWSRVGMFGPLLSHGKVQTGTDKHQVSVPGRSP